nr:MAG TPA: hypothetical protein [Caudoviricetes sp.]
MKSSFFNHSYFYLLKNIYGVALKIALKYSNSCLLK